MVLFVLLFCWLGVSNAVELRVRYDVVKDVSAVRGVLWRNVIKLWSLPAYIKVFNGSVGRFAVLLRDGSLVTLRAVGLERPKLTPVESAVALVEAGSSSF